jgi:hypothetical protein
MIFYHFTHPGTVLKIVAEGLKPEARPDNACMTGGVPVVWLTRQQSNIVTAADVAHMQKHDCLDRKDGDLLFGGTARLTVELQPQKRLVRYRDFLKMTGSDMAALGTILTPTALTQWYVYLGVIPPRRIDTSMPVAVARECFEHHIATHPDPQARERYKAVRAQIAQVPDGARVEINLKD